MNALVLAEQGSVIKYSRLVLPIADMCFLPAWEADGQRVGNPLSPENAAPGVQKSAFSQLRSCSARVPRPMDTVVLDEKPLSELI